MTKNKKSNNDQKLSEKLIDLMLYHSIEESNNYINLMDAKIKFIMSQLESEKLNEPMKLFKKSHKQWEEKIEKLNSELADCYKKIDEEFQEIQKVHSLIEKPKQKKEPSN